MCHCRYPRVNSDRGLRTGMTRLRVVVSQRQLASLELQRVEGRHPDCASKTDLVIPVALISGLALVHLERVAVPFVPLGKGIEALRKLRRAFCGRGLPDCLRPPMVPLLKGHASACGATESDLMAGQSEQFIGDYTGEEQRLTRAATPRPEGPGRRYIALCSATSRYL